MGWATHPIGCFDSLLCVCAKVSSYHRIPPSAYRLRTLCTPAHYVIPSMLLAIWGYPPPPWTHPSWGKTLRARGALGLGMDWSRLVLGYSTSPMRSGILVAWQPTSVWCIVCVSPLGTEPSQVELDGVHLLLLWIYPSPAHPPSWTSRPVPWTDWSC